MRRVYDYVDMPALQDAVRALEGASEAVAPARKRRGSWKKAA